MVEDFWAFAGAGAALADWHLDYESVEPWPLDGLPDEGADPKTLRVDKMRFATKGDRSTIVVNSHVALSGIPEEAQRYQVNGRSAVEWILDRYQVKIDKASGIVNDPNTWSKDPPSTSWPGSCGCRWRAWRSWIHSPRSGSDFAGFVSVSG